MKERSHMILLTQQNTFFTATVLASSESYAWCAGKAGKWIQS